ncbi:MAG: signal peptidase II [Clostridia bacterium]|nr:signal peptidase II [Clostridia bacterium]
MKKNSNLMWYILAAVIVVADFAVKRHILNTYSVSESFGGIPGVCKFIYVKNTGAAFSMLSSNTVILSVISIVFCVAAAVYWFWKKPTHPLLRLAVVLLFAGALGNAVDRVAYKFVVDFISVTWFDFPVFNIADMSIVGGAIAAVVYVMFFDKSDKKNGKADN